MAKPLGPLWAICPNVEAMATDIDPDLGADISDVASTMCRLPVVGPIQASGPGPRVEEALGTVHLSKARPRAPFKVRPVLARQCRIAPIVSSVGPQGTLLDAAHSYESGRDGPNDGGRLHHTGVRNWQGHQCDSRRHRYCQSLSHSRLSWRSICSDTTDARRCPCTGASLPRPEQATRKISALVLASQVLRSRPSYRDPTQPGLLVGQMLTQERPPTAGRHPERGRRSRGGTGGVRLPSSGTGPV